MLDTDISLGTRESLSAESSALSHPSRLHTSNHFSTRRYARIVKAWVTAIGLARAAVSIQGRRWSVCNRLKSGFAVFAQRAKAARLRLSQCYVGSGLSICSSIHFTKSRTLGTSAACSGYAR
ncbi:hypothetical protein GIW70_18155 [Pseudomonas syringae]|nr:hypothetical protein [Pseudomonas syringae]MCF5070113.1 hypothetical protein [Pseudomonas syringae]